MSYTYADRKRTNPAVPQGDTAPSQPSMEALRSGAVKPTAEQLGKRVDLPDAIRSKMETAFGADLSAVKLYESQAVADVGSQAITHGSDIAFAPGLLDFSSFGGQALLGHEISHVVSQARGEVTGGGFLNDASLEARADREGAMAAAGRTVAPPTASLSPVTAAAAAGPMQAKDKPWKKKAAPPQPAYDPAYPPYMAFDPKQAGKVNLDGDIGEYTEGRKAGTGVLINTSDTARPEAAGLGAALFSEFRDSKEYKKGSFGYINNGRGLSFSGLSLSRMIPELTHSLGDGYSNEEITEMYENLMAPHRADLAPDDEEAVNAAQGKFDTGVYQLKDMHYKHLKRLESTFGTMGSQMHPEDFIRLLGDRFDDYFHTVQDAAQLMSKGQRYFDFENNPRDREFRDLHDYYSRLVNRSLSYAVTERTAQQGGDVDPDEFELLISLDYQNPDAVPGGLDGIHGPSMSPKEQKAYMKGLHKRGKGWAPWKLFGKFRPGGK